MPDEPPAATSPPRPNPFAFPSDTDFRFILLIATVLASSLIIFPDKLPLEAVFNSPLAPSMQCLKSYADFLSALCPVDKTANFLEATNTWQKCRTWPAVVQAMGQVVDAYRRCSAPHFT